MKRVGDHIRVRGKVFSLDPYRLYSNPLPFDRAMVIESVFDNKFAVMARDIKTGNLEEVDDINIE